MIRSLLCLCLSCMAAGEISVAEGLVECVNSQGAPTDISILEKNRLGPTRVSFQSQVWRDIPWRHELLIKRSGVTISLSFF